MTDPVRDVDRRNGNAARARKQAAKPAGVIEHEDGSVHRLAATSLVIPEEKRCTAMTVRGERCKAGRMKGVHVCTFHAHRALTPEGLEALADGRTPRLTPRKALQAVVQLRAEELAQAAVRGALETDGPRATSAVLALVDAVDPLVNTEAGFTLTSEGVEQATYKQLRSVYSTPQTA